MRAGRGGELGKTNREKGGGMRDKENGGRRSEGKGRWKDDE